MARLDAVNLAVIRWQTNIFYHFELPGRKGTTFLDLAIPRSPHPPVKVCAEASTGRGQGGGSNDTVNLGAAANMVVDAAANELYVADGYINHRIVVFDATTGLYKRHWGAYGKRPDDSYFTQAGEKLPPPFSGAAQHENRPSQYDPGSLPAAIPHRPRRADLA